MRNFFSHFGLIGQSDEKIILFCLGLLDLNRKEYRIKAIFQIAFYSKEINKAKPNFISFIKIVLEAFRMRGKVLVIQLPILVMLLLLNRLPILVYL